LISLSAVLVSIITRVLLAGTVYYARRQWQEMSAATIFTGEAAGTANGQLSLMRQQLTSSEMARVVIYPHINEQTASLTMVDIFPVGQDPATNVRGELTLAAMNIEDGRAIGSSRQVIPVSVPYPLTRGENREAGLWNIDTHRFAIGPETIRPIPSEAQEKISEVTAFLEIKGHISFFNGIEEETDPVCFRYVNSFSSIGNFFDCGQFIYRLSESRAAKKRVDAAKEKSSK
jgi:hypothetical protein